MSTGMGNGRRVLGFVMALVVTVTLAIAVAGASASDAGGAVAGFSHDGWPSAGNVG